ncbi:MAG: serine/threonine-protein kinase [Myxococcota bacterium]
MKSHATENSELTRDNDAPESIVAPRAQRIRAAIPDAQDLRSRVMMASLAGRLFEAKEPVCVGRFRVLRTLGHGGMGIVYAADDPTLQRQVALKILRPERHGAEEGRARMVREGRAMAKLDHPGVLRIFEVGEIDDQVYVVMELAEGGTLGDWLTTKPRSLDAILDRFLEAGAGLAAAHERDLVHRDFKPHNVFIRGDGRACVGDFSLARPIDPGDDWGLEDAELDTEDGARMTPASSAFAGTPGYMPPEQVAGLPVDARADQYAFCVALHEALHGARPERQTTTRDAEPSPRSSSSSRGRPVPRALRVAIERGLRPRAAERFEDMPALLSRLEAVRHRRRRRVRILAGLSMLGAVGAAVVLSGEASSVDTPCEGAPERLAAVWSSEQGAAVTRAFEATGVPGAATTAAGVSEGLDDYGRRWADEYRERCEDTRVRGLRSELQFSAAVACLDEQRGALQALVDRLTSADEATVEHALSSVFVLADPARCGELERLQARSEMAPPLEHAADIDALRAELHRVRAEITTGHESAVASQAEAIDSRATALGHPPLQADTGLMLGRLERNLQRHEEAARHLEASYFASIVAEDFERACKAAAELVDVQATWLGRPEQGELWRKHAAIALEKVPTDECRVRLRFAEANAANQRGDYAGALELLDGLVTPPRGYDDRIQAAALRSEALTRLGRTEESERVLLQGIADASAVLGPSHPQVCRLRIALGAAYGSARQDAAAREQFTAALEGLEASVAPDDVRIAQVLGNLAHAMDGETEYETVRAHLLRALDIYRGHPHSMRTRAPFIMHGLGGAAYGHGDYVEAENYFVEALALLEVTRGPEHHMIAATRSNIAAAQLEQGRFEDARESYERALAGTRSSLGEDHPEYARLLGQLRDLHVRAGNDAAAADIAAQIDRLAAPE